MRAQLTPYDPADDMIRQLQLTSDEYASGKFGDVIVPVSLVKSIGLSVGEQAPPVGRK